MVFYIRPSKNELLGDLFWSHSSQVFAQYVGCGLVTGITPQTSRKPSSAEKRVLTNLFPAVAIVYNYTVG